MLRSTAVFIPNSRLSASELQSAARDGELVTLGEGFVSIDAPDTPFIRAASLSPVVLDSRVIIADRSAAWVWGWGAMPPTVSTCVSIAARIPSPDRRRLRAREVVIADDERVTLGDIAVTSPARTLVDLARHDAGHDLHDLLARGLRQSRIDRDHLFAMLSGRTNLSFVRAARRHIVAAMAETSHDHEVGGSGQTPRQPLLTRYTS